MNPFEQAVAEALDVLEPTQEYRYAPVERAAIRDFLRLKSPQVAAAIQAAAQAPAIWFSVGGGMYRRDASDAEAAGLAALRGAPQHTEKP